MMRRRQKRQREIAFGLDSFLDVITNVIGIIIRMILVVWISARSYHAMQAQKEPESPPPQIQEVAQEKVSDPMQEEIARRQQELERARQRLLQQLRKLPTLEITNKNAIQHLQGLVSKRQEMEKQSQFVSTAVAEKVEDTKEKTMTMVELQKRSQKLHDDLLALEKSPHPTKALYYRTPVSRPVATEELFFECREGRVSFIDIGAFVREMRIDIDKKGELLRNQWQFEGTTQANGAFRLRYIIERRKQMFDRFAGAGAPIDDSNFSYGLKEWVVEPLTEVRGEKLEKALQKNSEFRQIVDHVDPRQTVVTFWVYPDSFALFRQLRDYLYQNNLEVAGRPIPFGMRIRGSPHGTASRGQ